MATKDTKVTKNDNGGIFVTATANGLATKDTKVTKNDNGGIFVTATATDQVVSLLPALAVAFTIRASRVKSR